MGSKPETAWIKAHERNYSEAGRGARQIDGIIIHVTQGSWSGAINWFRNKDALVSAHYVIRSSDGKIAQCVSDEDIAYHAGNWSYNKRTIGIEHEGYVDDPKWFTTEMFRSSAWLAAYLCHRYNIDPNRGWIIGHYQVPGSDHTDPGKWWDWDYYMDLVHSYYGRMS